MNTIIALSAWDLTFAASLVLVLAGLTWSMHLGLARSLLVAAVRTTLQLMIVGLVLKALFAHVHMGWIALISFVMLAAASREVMARQKRRFRGWQGFGIGTLSLCVTTFCTTVLALSVLIRPDPWYAPQYSIPLLGMLLGNSMNGIALSMDYLTDVVSRERAVIEARLILGHTPQEAMFDIRRDSVRVGLIPIINAMAAAGLISLPGMMTGQILAGGPPLDAVKYQILIMFLIACVSGFGAHLAVWLATFRCFDKRHRLRLDRLKQPQ